MFNLFKKREQSPSGASVEELPDGRFGVTGLTTTYARRRDAIRGAKRRGLIVE